MGNGTQNSLYPTPVQINQSMCVCSDQKRLRAEHYKSRKHLKVWNGLWPLTWYFYYIWWLMAHSYFYCTALQ